MRTLALLCCIASSSAADLPESLQKFVDLAGSNPEAAVEEIKKSGMRAAAPEIELPTYGAPEGSTLPTVLGHGMGDSCWEPGMASITKAIAKRTGSYARCVPTGANILSDTIDGFLMSMDHSVDIFASKIRADPKLANGFNCIGFSQGNSLCRGYIQKYNNPSVNAFISVHGTVMGVAAIPQCFSQEKPLGLLCKAIAEIAGDLAYTPPVQHILFQADYFRHNVGPRAGDYMAHSQIAGWNNENPKRANATYKANFAKTKIFAMVKAAKDSMVYPNEGEHWGSMADAPDGKKILTMKETKFYKEDLFGLRTADEAGKIFFEETTGDHLQFSLTELNNWVDKYFLGKNASALAASSAAVLPESLQKFVDLANSNPEAAVEEIKKSGMRAVAPEIELPAYGAPEGSTLPTVLGHGMGDSCWEPGMASITKAIAKRTGSYARCVPTGGNILSDTIDGFLMNMDLSVDIFASKIRADPKLANGFNCIGFSQGNSLCRGYIQKYNNPSVNAFISVHGTVMGVAAIPQCFSQEKPLGLLCKAIAEIAGDLAYTPPVQHILFQADYFRHNVGPRAWDYMAHSQIAGWNNENPKRANATYNANFAKTNIFAMVKAAKDSMVYPNEGEHWGCMSDAPDGKKILSMKETKFYKDDLFGLRTADEAGKIFFEDTAGDHLQFSLSELNIWVDKYFLRNLTSTIVV